MDLITRLQLSVAVCLSVYLLITQESSHYTHYCYRDTTHMAVVLCFSHSAQSLFDQLLSSENF